MVIPSSNLILAGSVGSITGNKMIKPHPQPSTLPPVGGGIKAGRKGVRFGKGEKGVGGIILVPVILRVVLF